MTYDDDVSRILRLAAVRLTEAEQVESPDEENRRDDERRARETRIRRAIAIAFKRIGLPIARNGIIYFEEDREAVVMLDESEVELDTLIKLKQTGLSQKYEIHAGQDHELRVEFIVVAAMDNAVVS